jgi:hypothetical protein
LGHEAENLIPVKKHTVRKPWMMASETSDGSKYGQHGMKKTLKVTAWWKKAQDRDSWKAVIKEAKAHKEEKKNNWTKLYNI